MSQTTPVAGKFPAGPDHGLQPVVSTRGLCKTFAGKAGFFAKKPVRAVRGVNLDFMPGRTLGLVGESGCGKSTVGRMVVGLMPPSAGEVLVRGAPLFEDKGKKGQVRLERPELTGKMQMVFQDPFSSLNPRMRVGESVAEPLACLGVGKAEREKAVAAMFQRVGLEADLARRYPHEFSGGQRQRIAIARALIVHPFFVVCDEPTSSLDASVQAQVLNLLKEMQEELNLTYLFISHDLAVVRHMSEITAVMYAGLIVEQGPSEALFAEPRHPYTRLLLASVPGAPQENGNGRNHGDAAPQAALLSSDIPGCPFMDRCPLAASVCGETLPELRPLSSGEGRERLIRCHMVEK